MSVVTVVTPASSLNETVTGRAFTIGSVYATLDRLEAKGQVTSERTSQTKADEVSRRIFSVTSFGVECLELTRDTRERLWMGVRLRETRR